MGGSSSFLRCYSITTARKDCKNYYRVPEISYFSILMAAKRVIKVAKDKSFLLQDEPQQDIAMETDHQHGCAELNTEPASRWVGSPSSNTANCLVIYLLSNMVPLDWGTNCSTGQSLNVSVISKNHQVRNCSISQLVSDIYSLSKA